MRRIRAVLALVAEVPRWLRARGLGPWSPLIFLLLLVAGLLALSAAAPSLTPLVYVLF